MEKKLGKFGFWWVFSDGFCSLVIFFDCVGMGGERLEILYRFGGICIFFFGRIGRFLDVRVEKMVC